MSFPFQISTGIERVRQLCGLGPFTANSQVTSTAVLDYFKTAAVLLGGMVKEYSDEELLTSSGTITTVPNVAQVSLPTHFSDLIRIVWMRTPTEEIPLEWANVDDWEANPSGGLSNAWTTHGPIKYRLMGANTIELYPTPPGAYTLKLHYTTGIYVTSTSDTLIVRDGWDQWMVLQCCIFVRTSQQKDGSEFWPQLQMLEASIRKQLRRDKFGVQTIRDLRGSMCLPGCRCTRCRGWCF